MPGVRFGDPADPEQDPLRREGGPGLPLHEVSILDWAAETGAGTLHFQRADRRGAQTATQERQREILTVEVRLSRRFSQFYAQSNILNTVDFVIFIVAS